MNSLEIKKVGDEFDLKRLAGFMSLQPQYYPKYDEWLHEKCLPRIELGLSQGLIVVQDGDIVGDAVYQKIEKPESIEIKNFRIDPGYRNRAIGHFLLRQVEVEGLDLAGADHGNLKISTDVSTPNFSGVEFFVRNNFHIVGIEELYREDQKEYLLEKIA